MKKRYILVLGFITYVLAACSMFEAINNNPATADFVIKVAVTQFIDAESDIEKRLDRARKVNEKVSGFKSALEGNPELSLNAMEQQFRDSIDWAQLDVGDKILADALIANVRLQLQSKVGDGQLNTDYSIAAKTLLNVILASTKFYGI